MHAAKTELNGEIDNSTIIFRDFKVTLPIIIKKNN